MTTEEAVKKLADMTAQRDGYREMYQRLVMAVCEHRDQTADDRCWMDDQALYAAAGLGPADNAMPPEEKFIENCRAFYKNRCRQGDWPSYQDLQTKIELLEAKISVLEAELAGTAAFHVRRDAGRRAAGPHATPFDPN